MTPLFTGGNIHIVYEDLIYLSIACMQNCFDEDLAATVTGQVVEIMPKYKPNEWMMNFHARHRYKNKLMTNVLLYQQHKNITLSCTFTFLTVLSNHFSFPLPGKQMKILMTILVEFVAN